VGSELLTSLASAPQDNPENRAKLVTVTLGVGIVAGVFVSAVALLTLDMLGVVIGQKELLIVAGGIAGLIVLAALIGKLQQRRRSDRTLEAMEKITSLFS